MELRELTSVEEFGRVAALEREVWGYTSAEDEVPTPIMIVTQKIGGLLVGAFDDDSALVGFVYSLPGIKDGRPFQWSHMLGVSPAHRNRGIGWRLKVEQRRLTLSRGLDLVEWTFDPLQAPNAHLNLARLGAIVREYHDDVYGESSSPLHQGTPTDRFIAEWWIRSARVEARLGGGASANGDAGDAARAADVVNETTTRGDDLAPGASNLSLDAPTIAVAIPSGFSEMQRRDPGLARAWRSATREIFHAYLTRGYQVREFLPDRSGRRGLYLLQRP